MILSDKNRSQENQNSQELFGFGKNRIVLLLVLFLFAFLIIGIEVWQLKNTINGPFIDPDSEEYSSCSGGSCYENVDDAQDTDNDGLTDREEIEIYKTSPYMKDTDSDGIDDKEEIEAGQDPNCPQGKDCDGRLYNSEGSEVPNIDEGDHDPATSSASAGENINTLEDQELSAENIDEETLRKILEGESDAGTLREALKTAGMDEEFLDQISDEQLIEIYYQSLTPSN
jgi:hypothetical protein